MTTNTLPSLPDIPEAVCRHCPGHPGYAVTSAGIVLSCKNARWGYRAEWRPLKAWPDSFGYLRVGVGWANGRQVFARVHTLVLEAFVGPCPEGMLACHDPDHTPTNNNVSNLRWGTQSENMEDAKKHGRHAGFSQRGERHARCKLTDSDVLEIRSAAGKTSRKQLASRFNTSVVTICRIQCGTRRKHTTSTSKETAHV
jgi:hypothetical protein